MTTQKFTSKGDFILIERANRTKLNSMYRHLNLIGCTMDEKSLISTATEMYENRQRGLGITTTEKCLQDTISSLEEAVAVLEDGGWIILKFMN